jgi:hypothetical protein
MEMAIHRSLDFTKSSNNIALLPALETVDVEATVRTQLHMIRSLRHNVSIELGALPGGMCSMMITDRHWLAENVLCLLSNAVKYSDGGLIEIEFQIIRSSDGVAANSNAGAGVVDSTRPLALRLTISDSGIGVPESVRATLFQPFQQAQKMAGGTGLGLFSLRKRVEALGGCCGVASRDDGARGSAFWFEFPYRPDFAAMKAAARSLRQCRSVASPNLSETDSDIDHEAQYGAESCTRKPWPIAALEAFSANVAAAGASVQSDLAATDVFLSPTQGLLEFDRGWAVRRDMECNSDASAGGMCHEELQSLPLRVLLGTHGWTARDLATCFNYFQSLIIVTLFHVKIETQSTTRHS